MESGKILMTQNISSTVATTAERNHQSQASKRVRSGKAATQYVAIVSNIIPLLSFFAFLPSSNGSNYFNSNDVLWHFSHSFVILEVNFHSFSFSGLLRCNPKRSKIELAQTAQIASISDN